MTREEILEAVRDVVRRTGKVPGRMLFENETGIRQHEWYGRFWPRWGDVLSEAGFSPNQKTTSADRDAVAAAYLQWVEELGRLPTEGELRVKNHSSKDFPGRQAIRNALGLKAERVRTLLDYAMSTGAAERTISVLREAVDATPVPVDMHDTEALQPEVAEGFVYLMRSGKNYKIGRTNALDRRQYEIGVQLPEKFEPIHSIRTDDPSGIEAYWHSRFHAKRLNGEWFRLSADDVRAFKRRKFM